MSVAGVQALPHLHRGAVPAPQAQRPQESSAGTRGVDGRCFDGDVGIGEGVWPAIEATLALSYRE